MKTSTLLSNGLVDCLAERLRPISVNTTYQYPVNDKAVKRLDALIGSDWAKASCDDTWFDKTLAIRKALADSDLWERADLHLPLATWIVRDWGGLRQNRKDDALRNLLREADESHRANRFRKTDIASWSKYLAFRYPTRRAIYDARTAYSLNWLLGECGAERYFPFPAGRNTLLNALDYRLLLAARVLGQERVERFIDEDISKREQDGGKSRAVDKCMREILYRDGFFYDTYCQLLLAIARRLYPDDAHWGLTRVEMTLFGIATTEIVRGVFTTMVSSQLRDVRAHA